MDSMISIKNLRKEFGPFVAVENVSFNVGAGEVLGFLGPNGAGKSTTMKMAAGFLSPTAGTASICGHDIQKDGLNAKRKLGYLPEGAPAYPDMTPLGFLKFIAEVRGLRGGDARSRIEEAVAKTSLESHLLQPIETLSKGFKRRVGLAQAILHDPPVLIMDEPTDGLDPNQKFEVRNLIKEMSKDKAIILSTHILEEVEAVCTRSIIIAAGKIIADGTPQELQAKSPRHNTILLRLGGADDSIVRKKLEQQPWVKKVDMEKSEGDSKDYRLYPMNGASILQETSSLAREQQWKVDVIREDLGRLDDVFRDLTQEATEKAGRTT